jgi:hypothetical protein
VRAASAGAPSFCAAHSASPVGSFLFQGRGVSRDLARAQRAKVRPVIPSATVVDGGSGQCDLTRCRCGEFAAVSDTEFGEDVFDVGLYGRAAHEQPFCDLRVGESFGDERDHLQFGWCQAGPAVVWSFAFASCPAGVLGCLAPVEAAAFGLAA